MEGNALTINSMTGFSSNAGTFDVWSWTWELKSVNAKGLDVRLRVPTGFDNLEPVIRPRLAKIFSRGNITVGLMLKRTDMGMGYRINEAHLLTLVAAAKQLQDRMPDAAPPSIDGMLALRGVIEAEDEDVDDDARQALEDSLLKSLYVAADSLLASRAEEGQKLAAVLSNFISVLDELRTQAIGTAETQGEAIRARLKEQIQTILQETSNLDANRLEQEIALLMSKADIREELDRLAAHITAVSELLSTGVAVGRRLDFLCQELNREANTICSKAHETALTRIGLDMKATIEQFREQVQNIE